MNQLQLDESVAKKIDDFVEENWKKNHPKVPSNPASAYAHLDTKTKMF